MPAGTLLPDAAQLMSKGYWLVVETSQVDPKVAWLCLRTIFLVPLAALSAAGYSAVMTLPAVAYETGRDDGKDVWVELEHTMCERCPMKRSSWRSRRRRRGRLPRCGRLPAGGGELGLVRAHPHRVQTHSHPRSLGECPSCQRPYLIGCSSGCHDRIFNSYIVDHALDPHRSH